MRTAALLTIAAALASPARVSAQQSAIVSDSAIRAIIKERVDAKLATGIVVGVLEPNGHRRVVAYGVSGTARPLDENSVFEIGSITKTFTAAVLSDMVRRGEVRLDDPVAKYLPSSVKIPARNGRQITLLDLATQSSGLPRMPSNFAPKDPSNPFADYSVDAMYAFLSSYELPRDIGAQYEYSNLGVGLLGHALTLRANQGLETLYRRRLLDPLGMSDTRIALTPLMRERLALGHNEQGQVVPNWDIPTLGGAGALRSTVSDMLKYVAANLASDVDSTRGTLAPVLHATHVRRRDAGTDRMGIGLAWHILRRPDSGVIVWHNGGTGGYRTFAGYDPARRTGVVVLTNSNIDADDIALHLLAPTLPLRSTQQTAAVQRKEISLPAATLDRYVGDYELAPSFHIVVTHEGDGLNIEPTGQGKLPIFAEKETEFFLKAVDAQITFEVDANGKATALVLHQNGQNTRGAKVK
jgi:D-alanyl-D-alanine-carboxypeptidase/D-alanyl-D-alanine-endopeptidase